MTNLLKQLLRKPKRYIVNINFVDTDNTVKCNTISFHPLVWAKVQDLFLQLDCQIIKEY